MKPKIMYKGLAMLIILVLTILLNLTNSNALIEINKLKEEYSIGDYINLTTTLTNTYQETKTFELEESLIYPSTPTMPVISEIILKPQESKSFSNHMLMVHDTTDAGEYTYYVIIKENDVVLEEESIEFSIVDTLKSFEDVELRTCLDRQCKKVKSTFIAGDKVFVKVFNTKQAAIKGFVIYQNKERKNLFFENGISEIKLTNAGKYEIDLVVSKKGYKDLEINKEFTVIKESPKIVDKRTCVINNRCEDQETHQNCPQDCPSGGKDNYCDKVKDGICDPDCKKGDVDCEKSVTSKIPKQPKKTKPIILGAIISVISLLILTFVYYVLKQKKKVKKVETDEKPNPELINYIKKAKAKGLTKKQIKEKLKEGGWPGETIERIME